MPIIGHGDIASVLPDRDDLVFFASGISNSQDVTHFARTREYNLLIGQDWTKHIVYFSSLSVFYSDTPYTKHKLYMEHWIKSLFKHYTILRLGNIIWGANPHTLINFITNKIRTREPFEIKDVYRYVLEKDEFLHWINLIPDWSCELNIVGRRMLVKDIVKEYCYPWGKTNGSSKYDHTEQKLQICG